MLDFRKVTADVVSACRCLEDPEGMMEDIRAVVQEHWHV